MLLLMFILVYVFFSLYLNIKKGDSFLATVLTWITLCYVSNEILSIFCILDKNHLTILYGAVDLVIIILIGIRLKEKKDFKLDLKSFFSDVKNNKLGVIFFVFFGMMLVLAYITVPYNWDSMTYHLPRIMQWAQNKTVAHYTTHDVRQLTSPVLAEFVNLQVYILTGRGDSNFNFVQCFSYIINASLIFGITRKLNVSKNYCWLSMLLFVSMPIAFGEALSTQVDQFSTLFLLIYVYFILDLIKDGHRLLWNKENLLYVCILSVCIGLGYLAKPSIMFGMVFFAIWLLIVSIHRKDSIKEVICLITVAILIVIAVVSPEALRNIKTFHAISDPVAGARQLVGTVRPFYLIVNGLMNYTMNLPNQYINWGNLIEHGVYWIAYILGVNIYDPSIAEDGKEFYLHTPQKYDHDMAINPIIVIFATIVILCVIAKKIRKEKYDISDKFSIVAVSAFFFFCIILRWEPFVTRYMLSYLALLCPLVAAWIGKFKSLNRSIFLSGIITCMCVLEISNMFTYHRNITLWQDNKIADYFVVNQIYRNEFEILQEVLNELEFNNLGLYLQMAMIYEYPIWTMLDENVRVEHILVENNTSQYEDEGFIPEVIVVMDRNENDVVNYKGEKYVCYKKIDDNSSVWLLEKGSK